MMANQDMTAAPKPLACEIATYTEEELDRYLGENGRIVSVQDPENISPEFIQRLRDIVHREHGANESRAIDLDQVAARLQAIPADREPFSRSPSLATTLPSPPQEEQDREDLQKEKQYYEELVNAGGRPPYPFHLLEEFLWDPEQFLEHDQYRDIVVFWRKQVYDKAERTRFCGCHLLRWGRFRTIQRIIRERSVQSEWTLMNAVSWDSWERFVDWYGPMEGTWGFSEYAESVSRRLTKYGFTRPFQLDQDLDRQDKLTTWIEYLGYEYWFYDGAASYVKRFQRRHDEAWNKLVDSNVLGRDETYDVICDIETAFRHANDRDRAEKAVKSAQVAVLSTEKAIARSLSPPEVLQKRLLADRLNAAMERHETIRAKNDAIAAFLQRIRRYRCEKDEADRYSCLLRWIQQQIPSIELELNVNHGAEENPGRTEASGRPKRARAVEHNEAQHPRKRRRAVNDTERAHKRTRHSLLDNGRPLRRVETSGRNAPPGHLKPDTLASATLTLIPDTKSTQDLGGVQGSSSEPLRAPLRRSARIASKRKESGTVATRRTLLRPQMGDPGKRQPDG